MAPQQRTLSRKTPASRRRAATVGDREKPRKSFQLSEEDRLWVRQPLEKAAAEKGVEGKEMEKEAELKREEAAGEKQDPPPPYSDKESRERGPVRRGNSRVYRAGSTRAFIMPGTPIRNGRSHRDTL